jgi:ubiquinone/menaquinone biosynthesis C-methylase UbiE
MTGEPRSDLAPQEAAVAEVFAREWETIDPSSEFHESLGRAALRHVPAGAHILEIGVGPGFVPLQLQRELGCVAFGLDFLWGALESARRHAAATQAAVHLVRGSAFELPFREESFDAVMSFGLIEHYDRAGALRILEEHRRVCRPGGVVLVSTPSSLDFFHSLRRRWLGRDYPYYPERSLTPWALARELRRAGLETVAADGYAPLWGLRQIRAAHVFTAALYKTGILDRLRRTNDANLLSWVGGFTLQVARRPGPLLP